MRLGACALCLVALLVAGAVPNAFSRSSENRATFTDLVGEEQAAPDISRVRIANDDAGRISFRIALSNRQALGDDMRLSIYIDADDNARTGLTGGSDYRLLYDPFLHRDRDLWLLRCEGNICSTCLPSQPSCPARWKFPLSYSGGPTFTIERSELGDTRRFRFSVALMDGIRFDPVARTFDLTNAHADLAPNGPDEKWAYAVRIGPGRLLVKRFSTRPAQPRSGKTFTALLKAARNDTGAAVTRGQVTCRAAIDGTRAKLVRRGFAGSDAVCSWFVPTAMQGETIRGSITILFKGKKATKSFARKIG